MNAIEIIKTISETALNNQAVIDALNDGAALVALGITDADQGAVEDALAIMIGGRKKLQDGRIITLSGGVIAGEYDDDEHHHEPADVTLDEVREFLADLNMSHLDVDRITWICPDNADKQAGHWQIV